MTVNRINVPNVLSPLSSYIVPIQLVRYHINRVKMDTAIIKSD